MPYNFECNNKVRLIFKTHANMGYSENEMIFLEQKIVTCYIFPFFSSDSLSSFCVSHLQMRDGFKARGVVWRLHVSAEGVY